MLVAGVAEALQSIHAATVIHRDLKPGNIILAPDGPRVIDFGVSRAVEATSSPRTFPGFLFGTPAFMPPERVRGDDLGPAGDVFALGATAYYAATGEMPFGVDAAVFHRIVHESPNWRRCPAPIQPVLARCVDKTPERRPRPAELIELCRQASTDDRLRVGEGWLPATVVAEITRYQLVPPSGARPNSTGDVEPSAGGARPDEQPPDLQRRPVWVPWMLGGFGALAVMVVALVLLLPGDKGEPSGELAAQRSPSALLSGGAPEADTGPSDTGSSDLEAASEAPVAPDPGAASSAVPATTGMVLASQVVRLEEAAWDRDSLDLDRVPPTVTGQSRSLRVENGVLAGVRLAQWGGTDPPTAQECAEVLRAQPVEEVVNRTGLWFCVVGQATQRVAAGHVDSYDATVSLVQLTVWDTRFEG